jgi:hypothetical protein
MASRSRQNHSRAAGDWRAGCVGRRASGIAVNEQCEELWVIETRGDAVCPDQAARRPKFATDRTRAMPREYVALAVSSKRIVTPRPDCVAARSATRSTRPHPAHAHPIKITSGVHSHGSVPIVNASRAARRG